MSLMRIVLRQPLLSTAAGLPVAARSHASHALHRADVTHIYLSRWTCIYLSPVPPMHCVTQQALNNIFSRLARAGLALNGRIPCLSDQLTTASARLARIVLTPARHTHPERCCAPGGCVQMIYARLLAACVAFSGQTFRLHAFLRADEEVDSAKPCP